MKKNYKYMHLINNEPAFFDGKQIVYACSYVEKLCDSLKEIKSEVRKSNEYRKRMGWKEDDDKYGYIKVVIE